MLDVLGDRYARSTSPTHPNDSGSEVAEEGEEKPWKATFDLS